MRAGRPVFLVAFDGQADPYTVEGLPHAWRRLGEAAAIIATLKEAGVVDLVLAGAVRRPSVSELGLDWRGVQLFAKLGLRALGDDSLLRAVARELEKEGFRLIGPDSFLNHALALQTGPLGLHRPDDQAQADIERGIVVATALGRIDVGQAVVVQQGIVLGVEAVEGTDSLLARAGHLRRDGSGGVLVKLPKPGQERRIDLPTIGPTTIEKAAAAGLRGIAIEAGGVIVLDRSASIAAADRLGLFVTAFEPNHDSSNDGK